jgi:hypothetical protein
MCNEEFYFCTHIQLLPVYIFGGQTKLDKSRCVSLTRQKCSRRQPRRPKISRGSETTFMFVLSRKQPSHGNRDNKETDAFHSNH